MFINAGTPTRSMRTLSDGDRLLLSVGGNGHKIGAEDDTPSKYDELEAFLREHWPGAGEVEYRWSTHDYMPHDQVPYVGRARPLDAPRLHGDGLQQVGHDATGPPRR